MIGVGLAKMNSLVPYHFFLIWMQSLLSMATHNATILALRRDYRHDWVLLWIRQFLMLVNLLLSSVSGIFVLQAVSSGLDDKTLPIACVWQVGNSVPPASARLSYAGTISVIAGNCVVFALATWYLHSCSRRFYRAMQGAGLFLMAAVVIGSAVRICLLSQAFGTPSVNLSDEGERVWSYGQVLSILVLFYPLLSILEIYRGEVPTESGTSRSDGGTHDISTSYYPISFFRPAMATVNR